MTVDHTAVNNKQEEQRQSLKSYTYVLIYSYTHILIYSYTHILIHSHTHIFLYHLAYLYLSFLQKIMRRELWELQVKDLTVSKDICMHSGVCMYVCMYVMHVCLCVMDDCMDVCHTSDMNNGIEVIIGPVWSAIPTINTLDTTHDTHTYIYIHTYIHIHTQYTLSLSVYLKHTSAHFMKCCQTSAPILCVKIKHFLWFDFTAISIRDFR